MRKLLDAKGEIEVLKAALMKAEEADQQHANCEECGGEEIPELCPKCFPLADDARLMRRAALDPYEMPAPRTYAKAAAEAIDRDYPLSGNK